MRTVILFFMFLPAALHAQLKIDTAFSVDELVDSILVGNGIRVGNVKLNGHKIGLAHFQTDSAAMGMKSGILLSTGSAFDAAGKNDTPGKSGTLFSYNTNTKSKRLSRRGDRDLNKLCRGKTRDVNILEFDFVPLHNRVAFNYCFGSEEYREYVGSRFNDVFAFIISGPGVRRQNLAVIPGTSEPVTINNVNHKKNKKYYVNNDYFVNVGMYKSVKYKPRVSFFKGLWIWLFKKNEGALFYEMKGEKKKLNQELVNNYQYDGFTTVMEAEFNAIPYKKYHLKIAIGDAGDAIFDSGVFLEKGSLHAIRDTSHLQYKEYDDLSQAFNFDSLFNPPKPDKPVAGELPEEVKLTNIYFDHDKSSISDTAYRNLDSLAKYLKRDSKLYCSIWGYTDNKGSKKYNQELSETRARSVVGYLVSKGVDPSRLNYEGHNFEMPLADNDSEKGRAMNRRVEISIFEE